MAQAWQLICDLAGMECHTVNGLRSGEPYCWNIVGIDGYYRHMDLARCVLERGSLHLHDDSEMTDYYWNTEQYPTCSPYPEEPPVDLPTEQPTEEQLTPQEETPSPEKTPEP